MQRTTCDAEWWNGYHCSMPRLNMRVWFALGPAACWMCKVRARIQYDLGIFEARTCPRCGLLFPAVGINQMRWFDDLRKK